MNARPGNASSSDTPNQPTLKPPRLRHQFSNVILNTPTFNDVDGDFNHYQIGENSETGLHLLRKAASLGAIHDSSERFPVEKCEPGTRERTLKTILDWIRDPDPSSHILWLYGSPNEGTTAVLQSIAETCASSDELKSHLGGSFFFAQDTVGRDKGHHLFLTIAYQLAVNVPVLRDPVNRIVCANPSLTTKSISVQLESLIVRAFQGLEPDPQLNITVIIDGLDQCQDNETQLLILHLIADIVTEQKAPLRFLIGSRPKPHLLSEAFDRKGSARPQNGGRWNSNNSTKTEEQSEVPEPGSDRKARILAEKRSAFLERHLNDLTSMQTMLIEQNRALKVENGILERRLQIRDERIQNLEASLHDADKRLNRQNDVFEARLQEVKERLDRARAIGKSGQNKCNNVPSAGPSERHTEGTEPNEMRNRRASWFFSPARPSENPTEVQGPDEARNRRVSWFFSHARPSENPTEAKGPDEAKNPHVPGSSNDALPPTEGEGPD